MTRDHLSRREFIGAAGLGIGWGAALPGTSLFAQQVQPSPQYPTPARVRQNIASLDEPRLAAFKKGVSVMKSRPANDPTSWSFQANIHGTLGPVTSPLFNQCEHGTIQFLTWHRGYVYFFERILRAASGDPTLTLPYWDWSTAPALPLAFRSPPDASNPLYDGTRQINNGAQLPPSVVVDDLNTALANIDFSTPFFTGFSPSLEASPHGAVHTLIGGNMGFVPTAANDPIFWMHHCNIDRLWNRWLDQDAGRANPSDSAFLNQAYSYADESGQTVTIKVADMLTSAGLGYRYDNVPNPSVAPVAVAMAAAPRAAAAQPSKELREVASSTPRGRGAAAAPEQTEAKPLGFKEETVKLSVAPEGGPVLKSAVAAADAVHPGVLILELQGLSFEQPPEYTYEVLLNLPDQAGAERARLHRIGAVNFFMGKHDHGAHAADAGEPVTFDQRFDITAIVSRLRESGGLDTNNLSVTLRPITPIPPEGQEKEQEQKATASAEKAKITYQRINMLAIPDRGC